MEIIPCRSESSTRSVLPKLMDGFDRLHNGGLSLCSSYVVASLRAFRRQKPCRVSHNNQRDPITILPCITYQRCTFDQHLLHVEGMCSTQALIGAFAQAPSPLWRSFADLKVDYDWWMQTQREIDPLTARYTRMLSSASSQYSHGSR